MKRSDPSWMSDEEYQALDPAERRRLWVARKAARQTQRVGRFKRPPRPRKRMGPGLVLAVAAMAGGAYAIAGPSMPWNRPVVASDAPAADPARLPTTPMRGTPGSMPEDVTVGAAMPDDAPGAAGARVGFAMCKWGGGSDCVVDGDTFYIGGAKVRIAGVDAPETHDFKCPEELALGERAAVRLQALLSSGPLTMTAGVRDRDVYGRLLRNVAVNGADVGDTLIAEGLARPYRGFKMGWC